MIVTLTRRDSFLEGPQKQSREHRGECHSGKGGGAWEEEMEVVGMAGYNDQCQGVCVCV